MRKSLLILALLCSAAHADMVASDGTNTVRLKQVPCPVEILRMLPEGTRGYFQAAEAVLGGKTFGACWAVDSRGIVWLKFDDGDDGQVPIVAFEQE